MQQNGFIVNERINKKGVHARKIIDGNLYHLDFAESPVPFYLFPDIGLTEKFNKDIWEDRDLERFFRYIVQLRGYKRKFTKHVEDNFDKYGQYLSNTVYITKPLFKKHVSVEDVVGVMQKQPLSFIRCFTISRLFSLLSTVFVLNFRKFGKGEVVAFVGADGCGKTTAVEYMHKSIGTHVIYMGDINFRLQGLYDWLFAQNIWLARSVYFFMYLEQWFRYVWIWYKKQREISSSLIVGQGLTNIYQKKVERQMYIEIYIVFFRSPTDLFFCLLILKKFITEKESSLSKKFMLFNIK